MTHLEQQFADLWLSLYPDTDLYHEYRFAQSRRYRSLVQRTLRKPQRDCIRWDFAHPASKIGIDIQGGIWMSRSGHSGGTGLVKDYEKLNLATSSGWRVFLLSESMINSEWLETIHNTIAANI